MEQNTRPDITYKYKNSDDSVKIHFVRDGICMAIDTTEDPAGSPSETPKNEPSVTSNTSDSK